MSELTYTLYDCHALGLVIGLVTFLIIGIFHPIVIKSEYHFGIRCRWIFMVIGFLCLIFSVLLNDILWSSLLGVAGFSSFWSVKEILEQEERVRKGWFPRNPNRTYPWDIQPESPNESQTTPTQTPATPAPQPQPEPHSNLRSLPRKKRKKSHH